MSSKKKTDTKRAVTSDSDSNSAGTEGWVSQGISASRAAEAEKASKQTGKANPSQKKAENGVSQPPKPVHHLSPVEEMLALTEGKNTAAEMMQTLKSAQELAGNQVLVDRFIAKIKAADVIADYNIGMQEASSNIRWSEMTWQEKEEQLRAWARDGDEQAEVLSTEINNFLTKNAAYKQFLYKLVNQFIDPLARVANVSGLKRFLDEAADGGWVRCWKNPHWEEDNGLEISYGPRERYVYIPVQTSDRKEKPRIARAWPYIKDRLKEVQKVQEGFDGLRNMADRWLTPAKISGGKEGLLFVKTGAASAVLLEAFLQGAHGMLVRIVKHFGCDENRLPSDCRSWDTALSRPMVGKDVRKDPWFFITRSLDFQDKIQEENERRREDNRDNRTAPLTKLASPELGDRFEDQSLTRILFRGVQGVAAFWNPKFRWQQRQMFFGAAIGHTDDNGTFVLKEVVCDAKFPEELIGQKLPFAVNAEKLEVNFAADAPRVSPDLHHALNMVRVAMNNRIQIEQRHAPATLPEPTSEPVSEETVTDGNAVN